MDRGQNFPHSATPTPNFVSYNPTTGSMPGGPPLSPSRMQGNAVATSLALSQRGPPYLGGHQHGPPSRSRLVGMPMGPMQGGGMQVMGLGRQQGPGGYPGGADHYPPILDPLEFPSLTTRSMGQGDGYHQNLPAKPYGMVKQPTNEPSAFTMSSEDFPALPGTAPTSGAGGSSGGEGAQSQQTSNQSQSAENSSSDSRVNNQTGDGSHKKGIITSPDGKVTNIPASMVNDQFGMVGLLTFIRVAETDPNLVSLALGFDLTALGLNLNATDSLYPSFAGPWGEGPVRAEDIEFPVPQEYNISDQLRHGHEFVSSIREKLAPLKMTRYKEELLFYLFYTYTGDVLQILAAAELFNRDWRYHKEEKIWITRAPGLSTIEKGGNFERGMYYFFDPISFRKIPKEFVLEYDKLEERPAVPNHFLHAYLAP